MTLFKSLHSGFMGLILLVLSMSSLLTQAIEQPAATAHQTIEATTDKVMSIIVEAQEYYEQDPQRFYSAIETVLTEVVDFNSFARGVMGKYASKKAYKALKSKEEKAEFKQRMVRFSDTFKTGLVQTYAKGLLAFNGNKIKVLAPDANAPIKSSVTVTQHIYGDAKKPYEVRYKMRKNRKGEWKLRNVTIEAINLGKVYQGQFKSAARQYNGDVDKVIDNWSVEPGGAKD